MNTVVEFVKNYFVFLLVLYLFSYLAPQESYRKYFRFFVSALMIAVLMKPVLGIMQKDVRDEAMLQLDSIAEQLEENQYEGKGGAVLGDGIFACILNLAKNGEGKVGKLDCYDGILYLVGLNKALLDKGGNLLFGESSNMQFAKHREVDISLAVNSIS